MLRSFWLRAIPGWIDFGAAQQRGLFFLNLTFGADFCNANCPGGAPVPGDVLFHI